MLDSAIITFLVCSVIIFAMALSILKFDKKTPLKERIHLVEGLFALPFWLCVLTTVILVAWKVIRLVWALV